MIIVEDMNEALAWGQVYMPLAEMLEEVGIEADAVELLKLDVLDMTREDEAFVRLEEAMAGTDLEGRAVEVVEAKADADARSYFGGLVVALKAARIAADREAAEAG
jgi:hypothetical protein